MDWEFEMKLVRYSVIRGCFCGAEIYNGINNSVSRTVCSLTWNKVEDRLGLFISVIGEPVDWIKEVR